jgi:hypothetical protein
MGAAKAANLKSKFQSAGKAPAHTSAPVYPKIEHYVAMLILLTGETCRRRVLAFPVPRPKEIILGFVLNMIG